MGTYSVRASEIRQDWYVADAEGQILGRLASDIASVLKGKRKPTYSPHLDVGDHVIVINAEKVRVTGRKRDDKMYFRHSLYPGGHTLTRFRDLQADFGQKNAQILDFRCVEFAEDLIYGHLRKQPGN